MKKMGQEDEDDDDEEREREKEGFLSNFLCFFSFIFNYLAF